MCADQTSEMSENENEGNSRAVGAWKTVAKSVKSRKYAFSKKRALKARQVLQVLNRSPSVDDWRRKGMANILDSKYPCTSVHGCHVSFFSACS